jgi:hypothetical protein
MVRNSLLLMICFSIFYCSPQKKEWQFGSLKKYQSQLKSLRSEFRTIDQPNVKFFLFGMGNRLKMIYQKGRLYSAFDSSVIRSWKVEKEIIVPNEYLVQLQLKNGDFVEIRENEKGVFIIQNGENSILPGTDSPIHLPEFEEMKYSEILKELNHEILINIVDSKPLPNFFVYKKPWRRDGAMMAMCLEKTGNLDLIREWVISLKEPYDFNNAGEAEADNLGQTLYLLSLFADKSHPLVKQILQEVKKYEVTAPEGVYIRGRSDFHEAPVYQTKWLKFGLAKLRQPDPYKIPDIQDNYSSLFWWDYKESYRKGTLDAYDEWKDDKYPYIGWAADHFHGLKRSPLSNRDYPLTWEIGASQANYTGMKMINEIYVREKCSAPHTWHASEMFLVLSEINNTR